MPRSGCQRPRSSDRRQSFNEAGAIMPRSGIVRSGRSCISDGASMRPGQSCPGVAVLDGGGAGGGSRRFNEAGAIMPRSGLPA